MHPIPYEYLMAIFQHVLTASLHLHLAHRYLGTFTFASHLYLRTFHIAYGFSLTVLSLEHIVCGVIL